MEVKVEIDREALWERLRMRSSMEGKVAYNEGGDSLYDVVALTGQDRPLVEGFIDEAEGVLFGVLREFVIDGLTCEMPGSFKAEFAGEVGRLAENFAADYCLARWMDMRNSGRAKAYMDNASAELESIKEKIYYREEPVKRSWYGD